MAGVARRRLGATLNEYAPLWRRYLAPQRRAVALMGGLLGASVVLELLGPQVVRGFLDAVQARASQGVLAGVALLFLGVALAQQALLVLAEYWSERVAWTATNALRVDLAAHLIHLDMGFHKARTPGELIERVDGDVNALAEFFSSFVVKLLGSLLLLFGVVAAVALVNVWLGVAFAAFAVATLVALGRVRGLAIPFWKRDRAESAALYGYVGEVLGATEDLRSSGAVPYALGRFYQRLRDWLPVRIGAELRGNTVWMTVTAAFAVGDGIAYGLGGGLFRVGAISLGAVYLVVAYIAMLAEPIEEIRTQIENLQQADAGISRVRELLALRPRLVDGAEDLPGTPGAALGVAFHDVGFAYADDGAGDSEPDGQEAPDTARAWALDGVSFQLEPGRVLGLLGRTGSGKTTIGHLLFRLYDPQAGAIELDGMDVRRARIKALRARVGLVTQDVQLFEASLRDNITFFDPTISDARLLAVLDELGLRPWLARLPGGLDSPITASSLSAGEAQLLALARVFIKDPGLLILDEASSRLDPATEAMLERALARLLAGRTAIIIAHRLATVERANEIVILERGRVVEQGPRAELAADAGSRFAALRRMGATGMSEVLA